MTGESVPVTKTPLPYKNASGTDEMFNIKDHERHVLFCGTDVIQARAQQGNKAKAVVVRTGVLFNF